jgi:hypothetical protein
MGLGRVAGPGGATRLRTITQPVLVVNGKNDLIAPTINSYAPFSSCRTRH